MSSCSICGEGDHYSTVCSELYNAIRHLKDPQPTGPRGQDDEDDSLSASDVSPYESILTHLFRIPIRDTARRNNLFLSLL